MPVQPNSKMSEFDFIYHSFIEKDVQKAFDEIYYDYNINDVQIDATAMEIPKESFLKRNLIKKGKQEREWIKD